MHKIITLVQGNPEISGHEIPPPLSVMDYYAWSFCRVYGLNLNWTQYNTEPAKLGK